LILLDCKIEMSNNYTNLATTNTNFLIQNLDNNLLIIIKKYIITPFSLKNGTKLIKDLFY